jgi:hydroxyacylglutathione hydrolase
MVETDAGALVAVATPGHAREHLCFHWPARAALFSGDLVLGEGDTTWVAGYPGCVADYLQSLETLRSLDLQRIYPTHGGPVDDVSACLDRYTQHRLARVAQVQAILSEFPGATRKELLGRVYGGLLPADLALAAQESLDALLDYLGEADRTDRGSREPSFRTGGAAPGRNGAGQPGSRRRPRPGARSD